MGLMDWARRRVLNWLAPGEENAHARKIKARRAYREGYQTRQLKVKPGQKDDNVIINLCSLVVDRSVTLLFGKGVKFDLNSEEQEKWLDMVWDSNRQEALLSKLAMFGAESGTCYVKLIPDGVRSRTTGELLPRMVALDPALVEIETEPEDMDVVRAYIIQYTVMVAGNEVGRREVVAKTEDTNGVGWVVIEEVEGENGKWAEVERMEWRYEFPPILHWQNLPNPASAYGRPDLTDDVILLQDKYNYVASNIARIIRLHAYPQTWGRDVGNIEAVEWGPDKLVKVAGPNAELRNLEMQSDLKSSQEFLANLRDGLFATTMTVDLENAGDLARVTNFGVKVLYLDALAKLEMKRQLYGDALQELNYRLLSLHGVANTDGGQVRWPNPLPVNDAEMVSVQAQEMAMGILSKQTASEQRGYEFKKEQEVIRSEAAADENIGAAILRNFERGGNNFETRRNEEREGARRDVMV